MASDLVEVARPRLRRLSSMNGDEEGETSAGKKEGVCCEGNKGGDGVVHACVRAAVAHMLFASGFVRTPLDVFDVDRSRGEERRMTSDMCDMRTAAGENDDENASKSKMMHPRRINTRRETAMRREKKMMDAIATLMRSIGGDENDDNGGCMQSATRVLLIVGSAATRPTEVLEIVLPHTHYTSQATAPRTRAEMNAAARKMVRTNE